jgi:hypothetical protein
LWRSLRIFGSRSDKGIPVPKNGIRWGILLVVVFFLPVVGEVVVLAVLK